MCEMTEKKQRRAKRRPISDLPARYIGSFMEEPDGWDFVTGDGVAEQTLGKEGKPLPLASGVMGKGGWVVERYQEYEDGRFLIYARCVVIPVTCDRCSSGNLIQFGSQTQKFHDMPHRMKPTTIIVARQRLRCKDCGKTQFQYLPHMDGNHMMTQDLKLYIREQSMKRTFTSIAEDVGIDERTVRRIFNAYADDL
jgi:transposase-like protein